MEPQKNPELKLKIHLNSKQILFMLSMVLIATWGLVFTGNIALAATQKYVDLLAGSSVKVTCAGKFSVTRITDQSIIVNCVSITPIPTPTPTPSATPTPTSPTPTPTGSTPTPTPIPTPNSNNNGIIISVAEVRALPTSGAAWESLRSSALGDWGSADLKNQDNKHDVKTFGGALYYARTGDTAMRTKVRDAIMAAIGTEQEGSGNAILSLGRQLGGYVLAADLINLQNYSAADDTRFRQWLSAIRTRDLGGHGRWTKLKDTHENTANNWGTFAGASRIAASIYLGDTADVTRAASVLRAWLGERSSFPTNAPVPADFTGYFQPTSNNDLSWACDATSWTAVNPYCVKDGNNLGGAVVMDINRSGSYPQWPPAGDGIMYTWEALQGVFVQAEMLHRQGYDTYNWGNQALKRSLDFLQRAGWGVTNPGRYVPWMANYRYRTNYPVVATAGGGRTISWTDWMFAR